LAPSVVARVQKFLGAQKLDDLEDPKNFRTNFFQKKNYFSGFPFFSLLFFRVKKRVYDIPTRSTPRVLVFLGRGDTAPAVTNGASRRNPVLEKYYSVEGLKNMEIGNDSCPNCQTSPPNFLEDPTNGHYICHDCGLVRDDQMIDHSLERRNFSDSSINHQRGQLVDPHLDMLKMSTRILPASGNKNSKKPKTDVARAHDALAAIGTYSLTNQHLEVYFSKIRQLAQLLDLSLHTQGVAKDIICHYEKCKGHHRRNLDITCAALSVLGKGAVPAPLNPLF
jgi:hypothetical protein